MDNLSIVEKQPMFARMQSFVLCLFSDKINEAVIILSVTFSLKREIMMCSVLAKTQDKLI